jgi:hypothetical protein
MIIGEYKTDWHGDLQAAEAAGDCPGQLQPHKSGRQRILLAT